MSHLTTLDPPRHLLAPAAVQRQHRRRDTGIARRNGSSEGKHARRTRRIWPG